MSGGNLALKWQQEKKRHSEGLQITVTCKELRYVPMSCGHGTVTSIEEEAEQALSRKSSALHTTELITGKRSASTPITLAHSQTLSTLYMWTLYQNS